MKMRGWEDEFKMDFVPFTQERRFNFGIDKIPRPDSRLKNYTGKDCLTSNLSKYYKIYQARRVKDIFALVKTVPLVDGHDDSDIVFYFWDDVPITRDELLELCLPIAWCGMDMSMQLETQFSYRGQYGAYFFNKVVEKIRDRLEPGWSEPWIPTYSEEFKL